MSRVGYVYVGKSAGKNWDIGIQQGVWGWETSVLDRKDGHAIAGSLREGDLLVLARGGPSPRAQTGEWRDAWMKEAWVGSIVRELYQSNHQVWPDKPYPHRVDLVELAHFADVGADALGEADAMECLRLSGNKQGAPVIGQLDLADPAADDAVDAPEEPPNRLALVVIRAEQRQLRSLKFAGASEITCNLCGRTFPARLVRAAHVKRRSELEPGEHRNLANIMAACAFGCDEMFEHGYIYVDDSGSVRRDPRVSPGSSLEEFFASYLAGQTCTAYSKESSAFFAYHRTNMAQIDMVAVSAELTFPESAVHDSP
nr:hypothetical protein [Kibdelosporangium sp. MJ126-NF4]CEL17351.1 Conserved domain protein [Kibdelosporangium sp. MJ126-NF4]CTQ91422.1 Conserved domain protein [Kibdelosporangium sp. MJ126-NF4]